MDFKGEALCSLPSEMYCLALIEREKIANNRLTVASREWTGVSVSFQDRVLPK